MSSSQSLDSGLPSSGQSPCLPEVAWLFFKRVSGGGHLINTLPEGLVHEDPKKTCAAQSAPIVPGQGALPW